LLAMECDNLPETATLPQKCSAASKSLSAFWSHCATNSRKATSGGFIEDASVLVRGVGNPSEDVLRFFEAFRRHYEHVDRISDIPQGPANLHTLFVSVTRSRFDDEQIDVAVTRHSAACRRTEQDNPVRSGSREYSLNEFVRQPVVNAHCTHDTRF